MAISDYNQYVFNPYSVPSAPSIQGVNVSTDNVKKFNDQADVYMVDAAAYVSAYREVVVNRDYVHDKFMYDLANDDTVITIDGTEELHSLREFMTLNGSGVNYEENNIVLHQKVDNAYATVAPADGVRSANAAQNVESAIKALFVSNWLTDDFASCVYVTTSAMYNEPVTYDTQAKKIKKDAIENPVIAASLNGVFFYKDVANATGTARSWSTHLDGDTQYQVIYNSTLSEWQLNKIVVNEDGISSPSSIASFRDLNDLVVEWDAQEEPEEQTPGEGENQETNP